MPFVCIESVNTGPPHLLQNLLHNCSLGFWGEGTAHKGRLMTNFSFGCGMWVNFKLQINFN